MTASSILSALLLSRQPLSLPWTLTITSPPRAPPPRRPLFHLQTGLPRRQADGRRRRPPGPRRRAPRVRAGTSRKTLIETKEIERVGIAHPLSRPPSRRRRSFFLQIEFEPSFLSSLCSAPRALFSALCNQGMCVDALRAATIEVRAMSAFSNGKAARMIPARGRKKKKKKPPFSSTSSTSSFSLSSFSLLSLSLLSLSLFKLQRLLLQVDDRLGGEGTGKILGVSGAEGWAFVIVPTIIWSLYWASQKDIGDGPPRRGEGDDSGLSL